jgi:hypothetical protein
MPTTPGNQRKLDDFLEGFNSDTKSKKALESSNSKNSIRPLTANYTSTRSI